MVRFLGRFLILLMILVFAQITQAQHFNFTYYTANEGLPTDLLKASAISPSGFPLIASDDGLVLFDGQHFRVFREELPGTLVKFVHRLPDGRLLVSDDMGLSQVSVNDCEVSIEVIKRGTVTPTDSTLWYPKLIFTDNQQRTWISDNRTIYRFKDGKLLPSGLSMTTFPENVQRSFMLADDGSGYLFGFYEGGRIFRIDPESLSATSVPSQFCKKQFFFASSFYGSKIWAAAREGLWEYQTDNGQIVSELLLIPGIEFSWIEPLEEDFFLAGSWSQGLFAIRKLSKGLFCQKIEEFAWQNVNHIIHDGKGNIWLSSDNGLALMQRQLFENPFAAQINSYIQAIAVAGDEVLIAENSRIWSVVKGNTGFEARIKYQLAEETILRITWDGKRIWWTTTEGNIYFVSGKKGKPVRIFSEKKSAIFNLLPDGQGGVWFCQDGRNAPGYVDSEGRLNFPIKEEALKGSRIISLAIHPGNRHLILGGTTDQGFLWAFDLEQQTLNNLSRPLSFRHNVPIAINDIAFDKKQNIWLASSFGVIKMNSKGRLTRLDYENISETAVKSLIVDRNGNVWFTISLGLIKWDGKEFYVFSEHNGLPSKTTSYRTLVEDAQGRIWVGTISGIAVPGDKLSSNDTPRPLIRQLIINGNSKPGEANQLIRLRKGDFLKLELVTPAFPARSVIYRYRLISSNEIGSWQPFRNIAEVFTDNLSTGHYQIEFEARKSGNYRWSDPLIMKVKIGLKWYQNKWILAGSALSLLFLILIIIRYQAFLHRAREAELEKIISERTREILEKTHQIEQQNSAIVHKNTELEVTNKALHAAKLKAEKLAQARSLFLSTISHELRTPLNAVIGMTYILLNENPRPDQVENLNTLKFSAENLLALINDILDYSKIDAGRLVFEEADFDIREKVNSVVQVLQVKANERGIRIFSELSPDIPDFVIGDPTRFNQILFNLAGNAVKFTHEGYVKIQLTLIERTANHISLRIDIEDTGIGIPADKLPQIFESFSQAGVDITRKYGGTGLGLAITKRLVEMQGGRIEVKSEPGKGSCFTVFISYGISSKVHEKLGKAVKHEFVLFNGENVLIVDDNQINLIVAGKFLSKWNLTIDQAENGLEAFEKFKQKKYALVLMDLQMPEMDGRTATLKIREYERDNGLNPTPVFALTASALSEQSEELNKIGMNDFITKPFNPIELNIKIQKAFGRI